MKYDSILDVIGNTPLVRISPAVHGLAHIDLYAKLEMMNPFGSVKDRTAWGLVRSSIEDIKANGQSIVELSSGNTAKALSVIASMNGVPFRCVTNRMKVPEIKDMLALIGARIDELPGQQESFDRGCVDDPRSVIYREMAGDDSVVHTDQYYNDDNSGIHTQDTGPEIIEDLGGAAPDYFIATVGTAGSSTGIIRALRASRPDVRAVGLVVRKPDFIPGIRTVDELQEVGLYDPAEFDVITEIGSSEALEGTAQLIRRSGILGGPTSGAAYHGALEYLREEDRKLGEAGSTERRTAVFLVCDRIEPYMSYVRSRRPDLLGQPASTLGLAAVSAEDVDAVPRVGPHQIEEHRAEKHPLIVDVRARYAFGLSHLPGSINIPDDVFVENLRAGMPFGPETEVLLVCADGEISVKLAAMLVRLGHQATFVLEGGLSSARAAGAELAMM
ncbi:pyridoxal-phosphate dependent enzyme [Lolliginicoccus suaedae]|uniref:pyridoxal-phosphate dependent enzyme n=1 Tax=Lolliginicoccus suaedae TaxID=2605429 RepID=UPI0011EE5E76|nr:pyridoxal-phosphate dependent enzyme [Lolliginicoccus suaedae]